MASNPQGYDEERFATTVNRNFICSICFNVLRNPVECPRNQHCFCRDCITKYLQNSQKCPTCADELTEDTLTEPSRIAKDYLNELNIHCKYVNKGCHEIVQLQHLDRHEAACGFTPVVCTNQGCGVTVNKRDQIRHESELCEFRKLKCHSCGEMTKTLADIEKRMANMEKDMATNKTTMATQLANMEKMKKKLEKMENMAINVEKNMADMKTDMEGRLEAVNNEVTGLKAALIEGFNEMKEVLVKIEDTREKRTRDVRGGASGDKEKENTIVVGGLGIDSVEIFNWPRQTWSPLHALPDKRYGGTSFVYNNHVTIAGGYCSGPGYVDNMIKLNIDPNTDVSAHWIKCPVKIPAKLAYHSSVLYNNHLIVTGGYNKSLNDMSECIDEVQLAPPYTTKTLSKMPEPRHGHITEIMDDKIFIVGGRTAFLYTNSLSSVLLYDIKKNQCKQMAPLPYEVSYMASESWGDNIVVIGGIDKQGQALDTVIMYNVKTEQHRMLPSMRCKRYGCTAVLTGNNIIVMGGMDKQGRYLTSVEAFNFDRYTWEDLPEMSKGRYLHNAVAV